MDADESDYRERLQRALTGDFQLRERIGQGGMGDVYAARDLRLERDVAVKALRHDLFPTRAVLERFKREARAVARLRHPNILPIYAIGEGEGIAFMIMPLIMGENLAAALEREGSLPPEEAVRIATDVARALDATHRLGIVHRDVKPENILLEGEERQVLLGDFGIAKGGEGDAELTGTGVVIGSPHYMSPEQGGGERDIDQRSDVYSLGTVVYEMLSGRLPYEANSAQQLIFKRFTTEVEPLSALAPAIGAPVSAVVMRSLARNRDERWSSAGEFTTALQGAAGTPPVAAIRREGVVDSWLARRGPLVFGLGLTMFYLEIAAAVLSAAGDRRAIPLIQPVITLLQFGIPLLLAEMLTRMALIRLDGRSWHTVLRAAFGQPRWWQGWYPSSLRHPASVWDRMPTIVKTLRTMLAVDLVAIPLMLPLLYFVPHLTEIATASDRALPLPMRIVIGMADALTPVFAASVGVLAAGVLALSVRKRISVIRVVECLLTWRRDRWSATEMRRLLSTSEH